MDRRRGLALSLAGAAHLVGLGALIVSGAWQIDKLGAEEPPVLLTERFAVQLPAGGGDEDSRPKQANKSAKHARLVRTQRAEQPEADVDVDGGDGDPAATDPGPGPAGDGGDGPGPGGPTGLACPPDRPCQTLGQALPVCGDGRRDAGESCDDGNVAAGDGCSPTCRAERETVVVSRLIEGQRITGDPQIPPPDAVRTEMDRRGAEMAQGIVKMCLDAGGKVSTLRVLRSTGYPAYDDRLVERMRTWRYRPYRTSAGEAVPVCTVVTFIYRVH